LQKRNSQSDMAGALSRTGISDRFATGSLLIFSGGIVFLNNMKKTCL